MQTIRIQGLHAEAVIYTVDDPETAVEDYALAQIRQLCDLEAAEGSVIRVMPDVHPGKGCVIGLTMTVTDKIMPNLVGVDIGCGVLAVGLGEGGLDFDKLDRVIAEKVPAGFARHKETRQYDDLDRLHCLRHVRRDAVLASLGTLGGGNHFIEVAVNSQNPDEEPYLLIHSGSRSLGIDVCAHYLRRGQEELKARGLDVPFELTWLEGSLKDDYLEDMAVAQAYAAENRRCIAEAIARGMRWKPSGMFESVHNFVDADAPTPVVRKGAIAAYEGRPVVIPSNMRDGSVIGRGRGNPDWNHSAPHGSGRTASRSRAKEMATLAEFRKAMEGIHSPSVCRETLDEAPWAYRAQADVLEALRDTVEVTKMLRPVYNFKASGKAEGRRGRRK